MKSQTAGHVCKRATETWVDIKDVTSSIFLAEPEILLLLYPTEVFEQTVMTTKILQGAYRYQTLKLKAFNISFN